MNRADGSGKLPGRQLVPGCGKRRTGAVTATSAGLDPGQKMRQLMDRRYNRADKFTRLLALAAQSFIVKHMFTIAGAGDNHAAQRMTPVGDGCSVGNQAYKGFIARDHETVFTDFVQLPRQLLGFGHRERRGRRVRSWTEQRIALCWWHSRQQTLPEAEPCSGVVSRMS